MDNNRNLIIAGVGVLFLAIAIGLIIKGVSPATPPPSSNLPTPASPSEVDDAAPPPPTPPVNTRTPPAAPDPVTAYTTTDDGLQFADIKAGDGASPTPGSIVTVEYTGWLHNDNETGKMFDSSYKRRTSFKFPIGKHEVIAGWDEGVMSMKVGGKRQLLIPPSLGYGQQAQGADIPANSTLLFDVELLDVKPPRVVPAAPQKFADADYTTQPDGLKYHDITVGTGVSPAMGQHVTVEYTGWLTDGKMFDSSYKQAEPVSFQLGKVIPGWNEGLQTMKVGGKRQLVIPPALAYKDHIIPPGAKPEDALIPPNSTLVFEVELLDVK